MRALSFTAFICIIVLTKGEIELNEKGCPVDPYVELLLPHEDCDKFYQCHHGDISIMFCPEGLVFNIEKLVCDWPVNVDCEARALKAGTNINNNNIKIKNHGVRNSDPSQAANICAQEGSDGVLVAHENCNQFYKCTHGVPVALVCHGVLLYNPELEVCDWPENVNCGN